MTLDRQSLLPGTLDMLILKTLSAGSLHGYGIAMHVKEWSREVLQIDEGSLYPALQRLEHQGWITAKWGVSDQKRRARFYSLTRAGRKQLEKEAASWERLAAAITLVVRTV